MGVTEMTMTAHPAEDLKGIGAALAQDMRAAGYPTCEDLLRADPDVVADDLAQLRGISREQVLQQYIPQARLMRLPLPTADALALFDRGVRSYEQLVWLPPAALLEGDDLDATTASLDVARRVGTGTATVVVVDADGALLPGARVEAVNPTSAPGPHAAAWTTGPGGRVLLEHLRPGLVEVVVTAPDHAPGRLRLRTSAGGYQLVRIALDAGDGSRVVVDEVEAGPVLPITGRPVDRVEVDSVDLLADHMIVTSRDRGGRTRLTSALWRQEGAVIVEESATVPTADLPAVEIGWVVERVDDGFEVRSSSWRRWRPEQREDV